MSHRAKRKWGTHRPDRWMVEMSYIDGREATVFAVEELEDVDEIVEHGPDWRTIDQIKITLNRCAIPDVLRIV